MNNRIAVFYDGYYFSLVNGYYQSWKRENINFAALHEFMGEKGGGTVSEAHYYRGRLREDDANEKSLRGMRTYEEVLAKAGIQVHYLDLSHNTEKGIDVLFAISAFERALLGQADTIAIITGDADYLPLVRRIKYTNAKTLLLYWNLPETRTARSLVNEVDHAISMSTISETDKAVAHSIFRDMDEPGEIGVIRNLLDGFGFIETRNGPSLYFHASDVKNTHFRRLSVGNTVRYRHGENGRGQCARDVYVK
jgi:uncharacterized LabA/DUF88 family protein/cold shock CspA family protein